MVHLRCVVLQRVQKLLIDALVRKLTTSSRSHKFKLPKLRRNPSRTYQVILSTNK